MHIEKVKGSAPVDLPDSLPFVTGRSGSPADFAKASFDMSKRNLTPAGTILELRDCVRILLKHFTVKRSTGKCGDDRIRFERSCAAAYAYAMVASCMCCRSAQLDMLNLGFVFKQSTSGEA